MRSMLAREIDIFVCGGSERKQVGIPPLFPGLFHRAPSVVPASRAMRGTSRLLKVLAKHVKLALEFRQLRFHTRYALFNWGRARGRGSRLRRRSFHFTRKQVRETRLFLT